MMQVIGIVIVALGIGLMVVAGIGLLRFPDIFLRMSAVTKAATMGTSLILLATAFYFGRFDLGSFSRVLAIIFFIFVTAPVSAHMIGRAAYSDGVPLCEETEVDELRGLYERLDQE
ncbi:MAG: monovalent cation/H(+) antiporter subunit G [Anaerolineales bacterium]|nr:monovalent cation/H(+) antiporter subunit G [Anaerolineales bacterium]MCB0017557.1 monovalent cation/H(+) antiporter subunit G [Anaerolineales bacterium]MCB0030162.1 monovalent cation/H(+) antiporter subunit G [Anaerolineales bacterium]